MLLWQKNCGKKLCCDQNSKINLIKKEIISTGAIMAKFVKRASDIAFVVPVLRKKMFIPFVFTYKFYIWVCDNKPYFYVVPNNNAVPHIPCLSIFLA